MAKIKTLNVIIKGETHKINVNCTSSGLFRLRLPDLVCKPLNLKSEMSNSNMDTLVDDLYSALKRYEDANTTEELFIAIKYGSSGSFALKENGYALFGPTDKLRVSSQWNSLDNIIGFDFTVCMKITVDGEARWYETDDDVSDGFLENNVRIEGYCQTGSFRIDSRKMIPFTHTALSKLKFVNEQIRKASETLFDFVSQDDKAIEAFLNSDKMLMQ